MRYNSKELLIIRALHDCLYSLDRPNTCLIWDFNLCLMWDLAHAQCEVYHMLMQPSTCANPSTSSASQTGTSSLFPIYTFKFEFVS